MPPPSHDQPFPSGARVLVTGGLGFIGAALTRSLVADRCRVTVLDDGSGGRLDTLDDLALNPRLSVRVASVLETSRLRDLVDQCDVVFHLAAVVGVARTLCQPERTWEVNGPGAAGVIEAASRAGRRLFLFSPSEVYGPGARGSLREGQAPSPPPNDHRRWIYLRAKRFAERVALKHRDEHDLAVTIIRPFNISGPGQGPGSGMVLPSFVRAALEERPLLVHGNGSQRRVFLHIDDAVRIIRELAGNPDSVGRIVNVGGVDETTIEALARRVRSLLHSSSEIRFVSYLKAFGCELEDFDRRLPDLDAMRKLSRHTPAFGLGRMILDLAKDLGVSEVCQAPL